MRFVLVILLPLLVVVGCTREPAVLIDSPPIPEQLFVCEHPTLPEWKTLTDIELAKLVINLAGELDSCIVNMHAIKSLVNTSVVE